MYDTEIHIDLTDTDVIIQKWTNALDKECISIIANGLTIKLLNSKDTLFVYSDVVQHLSKMTEKVKSIGDILIPPK
jgi:hypothetical protein